LDGVERWVGRYTEEIFHSLIKILSQNLSREAEEKQEKPLRIDHTQTDILTEDLRDTKPERYL
jgi:hypothetical protein